MKRIIPVALVLLLSVAAVGVFASGRPEQSAPGFSSDPVKLTGQVSFSQGAMPELTVGDKTYDLMVPRFYQSGIQVEQGQTVTVEGYLVGDWCPAYGDDNQEVVQVTKATIGDKEYDLAGYRGGPGGRGQAFAGPGARRPGRGGMMGRPF